MYRILILVSIFVLVVDQAAKAIVVDKLAGDRKLEILGGALRLIYTSNTGAAFSILRSAGPLFSLFAIGAIVGIVVVAPRLADRPHSFLIAVGLIAGGALGNLMDRIRLGYVVDFIDLQWWPVFNLADSAIVIGVGLLALHSVLRPQPYGQP